MNEKPKGIEVRLESVGQQPEINGGKVVEQPVPELYDETAIAADTAAQAQEVKADLDALKESPDFAVPLIPGAGKMLSAQSPVDRVGSESDGRLKTDLEDLFTKITA